MFINMDIAGAEWHCTAYICRDPGMLEISKSKQSPHALTGSRMTGLSVDVVIQEDKLIGRQNDPLTITALRKEKLPEVLSSTILPRTMSIRQMSKKANFGLNYREGYKTFALKNEIDEIEARKIVTLYREKSYPGLIKWYSWVDDKIRKDRIMTNCFGRKIYFMGQMNDDTFRAATAAVPQSTVVDITSRAMAMYMNDEDECVEPARLLAQVHDSLLFEYLDLDFHRMARFVNRMVEHLSPTLNYGDIYHPEMKIQEPFKLDVEAKGGFDWGHLHEFKLTNDNEILAQRLRQCWEYSLEEKRKAA